MYACPSFGYNCESLNVQCLAVVLALYTYLFTIRVELVNEIHLIVNNSYYLPYNKSDDMKVIYESERSNISCNYDASQNIWNIITHLIKYEYCDIGTCSNINKY